MLAQQTDGTPVHVQSSQAAKDFAAFFSDRPRPVPSVPEPIKALPTVIYLKGPSE